VKSLHGCSEITTQRDIDQYFEIIRVVDFVALLFFEFESFFHQIFELSGTPPFPPTSLTLDTKR
jgi:hypothetical protein